MFILFVLTMSFGVLLTMHIYVKPSPPSPRGLRVFSIKNLTTAKHITNLVFPSCHQH